MLTDLNAERSVQRLQRAEPHVLEAHSTLLWQAAGTGCAFSCLLALAAHFIGPDNGLDATGWKALAVAWGAGGGPL